MILQSDIPSSQELFTCYLGSWRDENDVDHGESFYTFGTLTNKSSRAAASQNHTMCPSIHQKASGSSLPQLLPSTARLSNDPPEILQSPIQELHWPLLTTHSTRRYTALSQALCTIKRIKVGPSPSEQKSLIFLLWHLQRVTRNLKYKKKILDLRNVGRACSTGGYNHVERVSLIFSGIRGLRAFMRFSIREGRGLGLFRGWRGCRIWLC